MANVTKFNFFTELFKGWWNFKKANRMAKVLYKQSQSVIDGINGNSELNENYLFDFLNYQASSANNNIVVAEDPFFGNNTDSESQEAAKPPLKIKIKPVDVLKELETIPTPFTLTMIDEKISILKDKASLIKQVYSKREVEALIQRLENRKKYNEHKTFYDRFANITDEKIDILLAKYALVMKSSDIFIPEFPDEAIKVMKEYEESMMKVCGKRPVFYVIAEEIHFKKAYQRRDPILLVQSPFGFFWQILGAWDKEMLILGEL